MKTIGILEAHTIQTLTIAKSIKEMGFKVVLFYEDQKSHGYFTKYADKKIKVPSIEKNEENFHLFFLDFLENNKIDAVIPAFDFSAKYLSFNKQKLLKFTNFIITDYYNFMTGYDKRNFMAFCKKNNFPHPKTWDISFQNIEDIANEIKFPALIKPNITYGARGFAKVKSIPELINLIPTIVENYGSCHLQEFIPPGGKQYLVGIYTKNDTLINATVVDKLRYYPVKGGSSCFNQGVKRDDLIFLCSELQKKLNWEGYAHYDLIEDPRDGSIKVMELNPRVQGCIKSSLISGVNFVNNIIQDSLGLPLEVYLFSPDKYLRYFGLDLLWFLKSKNRFKANPSWFKGFFNKNHFFQDGSWDDPKPFIYGTIGSFFKQFNPKFRAAKKGMN